MCLILDDCVGMREEVDVLLGSSTIVGLRGVKSRRFGRHKARGAGREVCCIAVALWMSIVNRKTR
jgi:hypothetical protein